MSLTSRIRMRLEVDFPTFLTRSPINSLIRIKIEKHAMDFGRLMEKTLKSGRVDIKKTSRQTQIYFSNPYNRIVYVYTQKKSIGQFEMILHNIVFQTVSE